MRAVATYEDQDELFAEIALERNWLTPDQVREARQAQLRLSTVGLERRIWQVCEERGYLSSGRVELGKRAIVHEKGVRARIAGYEIIKRVGHGGMGQVFMARQVSGGGTAALKILSAGLARDKQYIRRFIREAKTAGRLDHPNIVRMLDFGDDRGRYYLTMEYVEGRSVRQYVEDEGRIPPLRAVEIGIQAARGLGHAHERGIVHRDIKPSNLLLHVDGVVKVADMGIAKEAGQDTSGAQTMVGTPAYVAPEQVQCGAVDARSDIYSLGATLYHVLTGEPPYQGATTYEVVSQHVSAAPPSPRRRCPEVPEGLDAVVRRMMAKDPDERYQSMAEVEAELEAVQRGEAPTALFDTPDYQAESRERERRNAFLVAATGSLILGVGLLAVISIERERIRRVGRQGGAVLIGEIWASDTNMPLAGVRVEEAASGRTTLTDSRGRFRLRRPQHGRHELQLHKKGYHTARLAVESSGPTQWVGSFLLGSTRGVSHVVRKVLKLGGGEIYRFSEREGAGPDLRLLAHSPGTGLLSVEASGGLVYGGAAPLSHHRQAPPCGYVNRLSALREGDLFFLRTAEGGYAKCRVVRAQGVKKAVMDCVAQTNGSRVFPRGPSGLRYAWQSGMVRLSWDEVSDATGYTVWRRRPGEAFEKLQMLPNTHFLDRDSEEDAIYTYAVEAWGDDIGQTDATELVVFSGRRGLRFFGVALKGKVARLNALKGEQGSETYHVTFFRQGPARVFVRAPLRGGVRGIDSPIYPLRSAPFVGYETEEIEIRPGDAFCLRTPDGRYAKFMLVHTDENVMTVEYTLQPDGSRRFPEGPIDLRARPSEGGTVLAWAPPRSVEAKQYRVWRRRWDQTWAPAARVTDTKWTDDTRLAPGRYLYGVSAIGSREQGETDRTVATVLRR